VRKVQKKTHKKVVPISEKRLRETGEKVLKYIPFKGKNETYAKQQLQSRK